MARLPSASTGLIVFVEPDDVVRFLRGADDVVVPTDDGEYMVNGKSGESLEELVERANRIRAREGLPAFLILPPSLAKLVPDSKPVSPTFVSPPSLGEAVLLFLVPAERVEEKLGDFAALFQRAFERRGRRFAIACYYWHVAGVAAAYAGRGIIRLAWAWRLFGSA